MHTPTDFNINVGDLFSKHRNRSRDRCVDPWWASFQYKGNRYRASLARWADQPVASKAAAQAVFDRKRDAIRGQVSGEKASGVLSFSDCADRYVERHIRRRGLRSGDEMEQRLELLKPRTE
jgi:hypothetical protein